MFDYLLSNEKSNIFNDSENHDDSFVNNNIESMLNIVLVICAINE